MLSGRLGICRKITNKGFWEVINPKTLGKWASTKVPQIIFPNPNKPGLQGCCFPMHNKKTN